MLAGPASYGNAKIFALTLPERVYKARGSEFLNLPLPGFANLE